MTAPAPRATLAVVAPEGVPTGAEAFLAALAEVVHLAPGPGRPHGPHLWFRPGPPPGTDGPVAVWWEHGVELPAQAPRLPDGRPVAVVVVGPEEPAPAEAPADPPWVVRVAAGHAWPGGSRMLLEAQRRRVRALRGLPARLLFRARPGGALLTDLDTGRAGAVAPGALDTALAVAGAAVVDTDTVVRALAWGTPAVVTPEVAAAHGLRADTEVLVRPAAELRGAAVELVDSPARAALLGRAGAHWARRTHDPAHQVRTVLAALGLPLTPLGLVAPHLDVLAELATPPASVVADRLHHLLAPLLTTGAP